PKSSLRNLLSGTVLRRNGAKVRNQQEEIKKGGRWVGSLKGRKRNLIRYDLTITASRDILPTEELLPNPSSISGTTASGALSSIGATGSAALPDAASTLMDTEPFEKPLSGSMQKQGIKE
ncbi:hypothetical protein ACLOJK_035143, partial [Asimina triloba]